MATNTVLDDRVFAEVKRLCCTGLDEAVLLREVSERLRRAVPSEASCAHMIDPLSGVITNAVTEEMGGEKEAHIFFERVYFEDDVNGYHWLARNPPLVRLISEATEGRLERTLRYRELLGSLGLGYELRTTCTVGKELWGGVDLTRERGRRDFNAREAELLRRIAPHLGAGLKAAVLRSQASLESKGDGGPGVLVLDRQGRVVGYTQAAERWLRELEELGPGWQEGDGLPVPVSVVMSAVQKALKPETDRDLNSIPRLCVRARSGRWLTFHGAMNEPQSDSGGETMVVIEPAEPRQVAWLHTAAYGLTEREREIVDLVVQGASTKQISATLYISEYTVQDHLSNIFDKVGVRSRRALVKQLYLNTIFP